MIGLSTSSYYYKPKISRIERDQKDAELRDQIEKVHADFPRAGYRTMQKYLLQMGVKVGETRLRRVMREYGLLPIIKKAFVRTTDSDHDFPVYKNLLPQMGVDGLNQVWVSDITYIRILTGFVFLAVILDVYSRKVVGWAISKKIDGELALSALRVAIERRKPPGGCIHHSDRGVQYLCDDYVSLLKEKGFQISHSAKGNPYDNAFAESFMKTLKYDEVYLWNYETYVDVIERLPVFIEEVYNTTRIHSGLNYLSPEEFEKKIEVDVEQKSADRPVLLL